MNRNAIYLSLLGVYCVASAASAEVCTTRISYGADWVQSVGQIGDTQVMQGKVSWNGQCLAEGDYAVAELSNGLKAKFANRNCVIALDYQGDCKAVPAQCETRITYGSRWMRAPNHPQDHDDVTDVVTWDGVCDNDFLQSSAQLSNGWEPRFDERNACQFSFRYRQCGGLFVNPVIDSNCPDPSVSKDGDDYLLVCTGNGYPLYRSADLVEWERLGRIFNKKTKPDWASGDFWAPELHKVGDRYLVYYSARQRQDGGFAVGVAYADSPTGPYQDVGQPLVSVAPPGVIDAHYFRDRKSAKHYLLWKLDGNAVGKPTPIRIQELAEDGLSLVGKPTTILSNDPDSWEHELVEAPWMILRGDYYYLFYSANGYASDRYGVGVARSKSPLGPFVKGPKILGSNQRWEGPGHGAVIRGPSGDWVHVYHAWVAGKIREQPGRQVLVDRLQWRNGWPAMLAAPSARAQPRP